MIYGYGRGWALLPVQEGCLSLGVHLDARRRYTGLANLPYGPYVDFHLGIIILSVGVNPIYAGSEDLQATYARGGLNADSH